MTNQMEPSTSTTTTNTKRPYVRLEFSLENEERLIEYVKLNPAIYNPKDANYKSRTYRDHLFGEFGKTIEKSGSDCQKRWINIRDSYNRNKGKKLGTGSAAQMKIRRNELMSFLNEVVTVNNRTTTNITQRDNESDFGDENDPQIVDDEETDTMQPTKRRRSSSVDLPPIIKNLKTCCVRLPRITCTATSSIGENLHVDIKQEGLTFSIKMKRKIEVVDVPVKKRILRSHRAVKKTTQNIQPLSLSLQCVKPAKEETDIVQRVLRPRFFTEKAPEKKPKPKHKSQVMKRNIADKPKHCESVTMGEIVLCKMRGFCEWPAVVTGFDKNLIMIEFFGDRTSHKAAINNFYKFQDATDLILNNLRLKKNPLFLKSIIEAENVLGITPRNSITNKI